MSTTVFTYEMGISHHDLHRILPHAAQHRDYDILIDEGRIHIHEEDKTVVIVYGPERKHQIALLWTHMIDIEFHYHGYDEDEAKAYHDHIMRCYQRGGG
ncbi:MAG: hypothetical protein HUJ30_02200 [Gammaproteobacteria bacterium]|nr:hypothetical protein [Gammaproteobacteria bacterium]